MTLQRTIELHHTFHNYRTSRGDHAEGGRTASHRLHEPLSIEYNTNGIEICPSRDHQYIYTQVQQCPALAGSAITALGTDEVPVHTAADNVDY